MTAEAQAIGEDPKPLTHRRVLAIAMPIVVSNATVPILGAVDTGVVGQMGQAVPIGAVGIGTVILSSIYWIFSFLRMGTTGLVGQAVGAGDRAEVSTLLMRALLVAVVSGVAVICLQSVLFAGAFAISPASDEVEVLAREYMAIRVWSAPAAIAVFGLTGWLIAQERTGAVLVVQLVTNGINIVLDLAFVLGVGWGVQGVAIATVIAEVSGAAVAIWMCQDAFEAPDWRDWRRVFDRARLARMAVLNGDILLRSLLLQAVFVSFLFFGAELGDVTLAANQVLLHFLHITAYALDGFAFAVEALVARAVGRRDLSRLRRSVGLTAVLGGAFSLGLTFLFIGSGTYLIDLMTTAPDVRQDARNYLPWLFAAPILSCAAFILDGIFIGATRGRDMRNMMALSSVVYAASVMILLPHWGNHGLWAALMLWFVVRAITLGLRYPDLERGVPATPSP